MRKQVTPVLERKKARTFRPLSGPGSASTLRLHHLMEEQQRLEIGERIKDLRNASPQTNRSIADYVGVGERAVANWIAGGGIAWENARKVAELFEVDPQYVWTGREKAPTPDPFAGTDEISLRFGELSEAVQGLRGELRATRTKLLSEIGKVRKAQEALQPSAERPRRKPGATGS